MRFTTLFVLASAVVSGLSQAISLAILQDSVVELTNLAKSFNTIVTPYGTTAPVTLENTVGFYNLLAVLTATTDRAARQVHDLTATKQLSIIDSAALVAAAVVFEPIITTSFEIIKSKKDILGGLIPDPSVVDPIKAAIIDFVAMRDAGQAFADAVNNALALPSKAQWTLITGRIVGGADGVAEFYRYPG